MVGRLNVSGGIEDLTELVRSESRDIVVVIERDEYQFAPPGCKVFREFLKAAMRHNRET
jgi:hypothetical protein